MYTSLETTSEVTGDQEKMNNFFNQNNSWYHVGSLCTDFYAFYSSMLSEIGFYNYGE